MKALLGVVCVAIGIFAGVACACQFDTDCEPGSKCYKPGNGINGWCVGGMSPGNQNDREPARDALDITKKKGNTCSFDTDCGPGGQEYGQEWAGMLLSIFLFEGASCWEGASLSLTILRECTVVISSQVTIIISVAVGTPRLLIKA